LLENAQNTEGVLLKLKAIFAKKITDLEEK
jgi:hypothetical protein